MATFGDERVPLRLWLKVRVVETGCWEWQGYKHDGYGGCSLDGKRNLYTHRVFYSRLVGPIPSGLYLDHLCRNRCCANPSHMEIVTNKENVLRGQGFAAVNAAKTHCPKGHPYDESNTAIWHWRKQPRRACKTCNREKYHRLRGQALKGE